MEPVVAIVGAGPAGLATSACLNRYSIPHVVLEKEDIYASLWKRRAYDRLKLHLHKDFCELPLMPHHPDAPPFMPKDHFLDYLDKYVERFDIKPRYFRTVEKALYDASNDKWRVEAKNSVSGETEVYFSRFVVVATGENGEGVVPDVKGIGAFAGQILHSSQYKSGSDFKDKDVLVVGSGNSGMEISFDLCNFGARTTICARSPRHVLTKEMVYMGMTMAKYVPVKVVDTFVTAMARFTYGDLSKYGLKTPKEGPFYAKLYFGKAPVIDVGTVAMIRSGNIHVVEGMVSINGKSIKFENGVEKDFDAIVLATGYNSLVCKWLKNYEYVMNETGFPKNPIPKHWKGEKNIYCAGFSRQGINGVSRDAVAIADHIHSLLS
ncbi:PREDICTED: probable indole-3-pyruvate monooxygenase YUCCA10 [Tarenaya hassleriana]|uniref:probable indole-3-pyruvate monooxygenase YUCCA10 n=1 Tax=Tarenaya hassleriana TaxID=28532 RepID=UPI00053C3829|nr:PREDICTED: probable indole-3-pyruvate monooxygenase YUCCA10 [Tarenaya hassleriana]